MIMVLILYTILVGVLALGFYLITNTKNNDNGKEN